MIQAGAPRSQDAGAGGRLELGNHLYQVGGVSLSCLQGTEGRGWGGWRGVLATCQACAGPFAWTGWLLGQWGHSQCLQGRQLILSKLFQEEENQICLEEGNFSASLSYQTSSPGINPLQASPLSGVESQAQRREVATTRPWKPSEHSSVGQAELFRGVPRQEHQDSARKVGALAASISPPLSPPSFGYRDSPGESASP